MFLEFSVHNRWFIRRGSQSSMPLKVTNSVLNPKDYNVLGKGREKEVMNMCMHAQWTGCIGLKVDIKSSLTRPSNMELVIPHLLPCDCLTPATQGPCGSNMLSPKDMTSSLSSSSPPFIFGCNPYSFVVVTDRLLSSNTVQWGLYNCAVRRSS